MMSTQISWQLTLFALLPMPVMAIMIKRNGDALHERFKLAQAAFSAIMIKRNGDALHERFKLAQAAFSSLNDRTQESLTSIRMIKAFGLEDRQSALFAADAEDTGKKNMRVARIDARFDPTIYIAIGMTQESLTSIRMIKAFGLEDRQSALFAADAEDTGKKNMRVARIDARFDPTIYIAIGMANLLAIGGGSWMVAQGSLTLGQLTSFMMYLGLMIWPMLALAWMFNIVERGSAARAV